MGHIFFIKLLKSCYFGIDSAWYVHRICVVSIEFCFLSIWEGMLSALKTQSQGSRERTGVEEFYYGAGFGWFFQFKFLDNLHSFWTAGHCCSHSCCFWFLRKLYFVAVRIIYFSIIVWINGNLWFLCDFSGSFLLECL